jgi:hypothetical protein
VAAALDRDLGSPPAPEIERRLDGGYEVISKEVFPCLTNLGRLLLEYDSDRAGTFSPLADVLPHHQVVLGLVTTTGSRGRRGRALILASPALRS